MGTKEGLAPFWVDSVMAISRAYVSDLKLRYLEAMGIGVWVRRDRVPTTAGEPAFSPHESLVTDASGSAEQRVSRLDWNELEATVARCEACGLHRTRTQTVFGVGNHKARWMIIGEAPGGEEDRKGEPFVGRAGQLLNAMLQAIGLRRDEVYIANILKCRPPQNRDPKPEETASCSPFLERQVELVGPAVILAVGRVAAQYLLNTSVPLNRMRGKRYTFRETGIPLVVTYHPAYLLRSPLQKRKAWEDLQFARNVLDAVS